MRLFIAIELPPAVLSEIEAAQSKLRALTNCRRWEPRRNAHLTLHFLGEMPESSLEGLRPMTAAVCSPHAPFTLQLGALGGFPRLAHPRVVFLSVAGETERLAGMHAALARGLESLGCRTEARAYVPHLTLCREPDQARAIAPHAAELAPPPLSWRVEQITLFQSTLAPSGAIYTPLGRYPLEGAQLG